MRKTGYYWVKVEGGKYDADEWEAAYYEVLPYRNGWDRMWFDDECFTDDFFIEINENRLIDPSGL